jgi:hypothetical protein
MNPSNKNKTKKRASAGFGFTLHCFEFISIFHIALASHFMIRTNHTQLTSFVHTNCTLETRF